MNLHELTPSSSSTIALPMEAKSVHLQLFGACTAHLLWTLNLHTGRERKTQIYCLKEGIIIIQSYYKLTEVDSVFQFQEKGTCTCYWTLSKEIRALKITLKWSQVKCTPDKWKPFSGSPHFRLFSIWLDQTIVSFHFLISQNFKYSIIYCTPSSPKTGRDVRKAFILAAYIECPNLYVRSSVWNVTAMLLQGQLPVDSSLLPQSGTQVWYQEKKCNKNASIRQYSCMISYHLMGMILLLSCRLGNDLVIFKNV